MSALYLSRVRLDPQSDHQERAMALWRYGGDAATQDHKRVWRLFADDTSARRDFLWRRDDGGVFYLLSRRRPSDRDGLYRVDTKLFDPVLAPSDRLAFQLAANAVVTRDGKRHDVVMDALKALPGRNDAPDEDPSPRARARRQIMQERGRQWLERQGTTSGFRLVDTMVEGGRRLRLHRRGAPAAMLTRLDFTGVIEVREPERFVSALAHGFGKGKAFGLGLMLIRRA